MRAQSALSQLFNLIVSAAAVAHSVEGRWLPANRHLDALGIDREAFRRIGR